MVNHGDDKNKFVLLGTDIPVKTTGNNVLLNEAFKRVQEKVEAIDSQSRQASQMQVALLAAMNLAGELIALEKNDMPAEVSKKTRQRTEELIKKLKRLEV